MRAKFTRTTLSLRLHFFHTLTENILFPRSTQMFKKWRLMFSYLCIRLSLFIRTFSLSRGSNLSQQGVAGPLQSLVTCSLSSANLPCFNKKRIIFFFQSRRCRLQWRAVCVRCFKNLGKEPKVSLSLFLAVWWHRIKRPPRKLFFRTMAPSNFSLIHDYWCLYIYGIRIAERDLYIRAVEKG